MSNPDEPDKKRPQPTVAWNPEDLPDFEGEAPEDGVEAAENPPGAGTPEEARPGSDATAADPEPAAPRQSQPTVVWNPEDVAKAKETGSPPPAGSDPAPEVTDDPDEDPLIGELLRDKWRVLKRLGAGSFGTVYKVEDVKGGWIEALKILGVDRLVGAEAETMRKRFLREAQIMKRLGTESAHIVGLSTYEEDLEAGLIYFLMEYVEGRSLGDAVMEDGPFTLDRTVRIGLQVCDALIAAHEGPEGVVHRDMKLENVMLTTDRAGEEVAKVLDFGIAKLAERDTDSRLTTVGTLGTPGYAAPEQLRAEDVDARTDLFAFGVILYALLTGRDPWLGNPAGESTHQIYELMVATERGDVKPFSEAGVEVPPAMQGLVLRLLRRDPDERFPSAREVRDALNRVAAGGAAADSGSLRVLTDEPGVEVHVRMGRRTVAEGLTPCVANGLEPGTYKVALKDPRYEPVETIVTLGVGAMEDLTLVTTLRSGGVGASAMRRPGRLVAAAVVVLGVVGLAVLQPWGRALEMTDLQARVAAGGVAGVRLAPGGMEGKIPMGPVAVPFRVEVGERDLPATVAQLRTSGLEVDTSWEVERLIGLAAAAQSQTRYFGRDGDDVRSYAERVATIEPESMEARSLLLKVAERMAWDAEAARQDGTPEVAAGLVQDCLALVPDHAGCLAAGGGD